MNFRRKVKSHALAVQMTSMLDIVFLLLCFFVSSSVFTTWESEVKLALPTAESATKPEGRMPGEFIFNLKESGEVVLNGQTLTIADVKSRLTRVNKASQAQNQSMASVVIRADKSVSYEKLMALIDACREAEVWNFSLATQDGEGAK